MEYEESEPLSYQEAINNNESMKWLIAMIKEFESLKKKKSNLGACRKKAK